MQWYLFGSNTSDIYERLIDSSCQILLWQIRQKIADFSDSRMEFLSLTFSMLDATFLTKSYKPTIFNIRITWYYREIEWPIQCIEEDEAGLSHIFKNRAYRQRYSPPWDKQHYIFFRHASIAICMVLNMQLACAGINF